MTIGLNKPVTRQRHDKVLISVTDASADLKIRLKLYSSDGVSLDKLGATTGGQA